MSQTQTETPIEDQRDFLHEILSSIEGIRKVYFQPPSTEKLKYPCIIYELSNLDTHYANSNRYLTWPRYTMTLIDYDPESDLQRRILDLGPNCFVSFDRFFTSDNLNHWAYTLVFTKALW